MRNKLLAVFLFIACVCSISAFAQVGGLNQAQSGPVTLFLQYPNYRGLLFSDRSQLVKVNVKVVPPSGYTLAQLSVTLQLLDSSNNVQASTTIGPPLTSGQFTSTVDATALALGTYQLQAVLLNSSGQVIDTETPAYTIVKLSGSARASLKSFVDQNNEIHYGGAAHFVLGVYDSPSSCSTTPQLQPLSQNNMLGYLPYTYADCLISNTTSLTNAMAPLNMVLFPSMAADYTGDPNYPSDLASSLGASNADQLASDFTAALASNSTVPGYYTTDEPLASKQAAVFHQYQLIEGGDPYSLTWGALNVATLIGHQPAIGASVNLSAWRDSFDIIAVDPYPINFWNVDSNGQYIVTAEPADWVRDAMNGVQHSRPAIAVLQFYPGCQNSSTCTTWPTQQQLHDMSWTTITEGVQGIFYWSWGQTTNQTLQSELEAVTNDIGALESVILSPTASVLASNSASGTIITRTKNPGNGNRYVFSYNYSGNTTPATFTLNTAAASVSVDSENRTLPLSNGGLTFSDSFAPYQAHIYVIANP